MRTAGLSLMLAMALALPCAAQTDAAQRPDCSRPLSLGLHDHGLLYSPQTGTGIDRDVADELIRRSGCRIQVALMPRARIWQLIEAGALDFSLSGISTPQRDKFAAFAWYFSNKYYLLVRRDAQVQSLADFAANERLTLGVIRSFRYSDSANRFVDELQARQRITQSSGLTPLFEALVAGQIQAMIIEPFDYPTLESARLRALSQIIEFGDKPVPHGLIMSRASLSEAEQQKWRGLVQAMLRDGSMQRIFEKYFKPELARSLLQELP
ncbi:transporter substrate-binding domain-containing protein [Paucibacter sp. APW11]|uniref:Transporter substrate-binding domain-containing protein n=1 Tax=Roseateles aquae TaxID=3077235 RepID=A0ABU3PH59_9BURK|nr:transporter substrate-binding domain-containing protein [Paucibacter sp. APW11]MDT9001894.1 transporter substrate-binding domain-containing protein [Paucibacter sp. APW11]